MTAFEKIDLGETGKFSPLFLDYISQKQTLRNFYHRFPSAVQFEEQIKEKHFSKAKRKTLVCALEKQYAGCELPDAVQKNLELLKDENTFTITTGHQLNLFTGPLYVIYKILTAINACRELKKKYPSYDFVPVYWAAAEDHDFEEINHFHLFNKKYEWNSEQAGAVGRFGLEGLREQVLEQLPECPAFFERAYSESETLTQAVRAYMLELFGNDGLLMIDGDDALLKAEFAPVVKDELLHMRSCDLVKEASERIEQLGYKAQVYPREINLFYLEESIRQRIVRRNESYHVLNTEMYFSQKEILDLLAKHPERFSPNVVLRPLYEEMILPNLAYVGGPGEIAYWLQLKSMFEHHDTLFPFLLPRNFAMVVNGVMSRKLGKIGLKAKELFQSAGDLKQKVLRQAGTEEISIEEERQKILRAFGQIKQRSELLDKSLRGLVGAEESKVLKGLAGIEKRLKKAQEAAHATKLRQLEAVLHRLFPDGGLQERFDNFLNFYQNNPKFNEQLREGFDPFDFRFNIIQDYAESRNSTALSEQASVAQ
ncbi:MAG: bacillithiol biosynthesis cysteine-adding enzyme BshC [Cytophagales bacterium]|nr:bacillithiol biosynthesis cysteine-adding enzyme BshC [Cytophagales bacterium]